MDYTHLIADRLRSRRTELEQALLARVLWIGDPSATGDSGYLDGFCTAVAAAVDFAIATLGSAAGDEPFRRSSFCRQSSPRETGSGSTSSTRRVMQSCSAF